MLPLPLRPFFSFLLAFVVVICGGWSESVCADDEAEAAENPIMRFFDQVFGEADQPGIQEQLEAESEEGQFRDNVDARAASDPRLTKELSSADWHVERGDWHAAIETLQPLLNEYSDTLCRDSEGRWTSLQTEAEARIGRMPADGLQAYRSTYGGLAVEMLRAGGGLSNHRACTEVASRYFHTLAGYQAANALALHYFDSGQFTQAAYWFSRLSNAAAEPVPTETIEWRTLAAYALLRAGDSESAQELISPLDVAAGSRLHRLMQKPTAGPLATFAVLDDWPMLYGSAEHRGIVEAGQPVLLKRWSIPLTARHAIRSQIDDLLLDLADNNRPPIAAWQPIMVDGKAAFRTMRGLAVVDVQSGELLWEAAGGVSAERLLSGEPAGGVMMPRAGFRQVISQYGVDQQDNHQLASLLFRDATYGLLSSNGRLLFSIEQHALMAQTNYGYWWSNVSRSNQDPYRRDWSTNQLVAFDLESGRPVWEVGGRRMEEAFDPPLAGVYLFGPPVPSGEELFVIGEQGGEIRLFVLQASTGEPLWSLPLAGVTTEIEHDSVRRLWAAQPAVDAGLVVCPTTVGWLVAVDWRQQRIRWAHRYAERTESTRSRRGFVLNSQHPLGTRWQQSAPIVVGGRVLYTPSEQPDETGNDQPRLICLDALTGTLQWERPKGAGLYVAGVVGETVVIVERAAIVGVSLTDGGRELWSAALPPDAIPSGRGVLLADSLVLPVRTGKLLTIDLNAGEILVRQSSPIPGLLPGNLAMHAGTMVSLGPNGVDAFELSASVEREIARRRQQDPNDPWATVREAEVSQISGDYDRAVELLEQAVPHLNESDPNLVERHHRRTFDCLLRICEDDLVGRESEFSQLTAVAESDSERFEVQRLDALRRLAANDPQAAFDVYWGLTGQSGPEFVPTGDVNSRFDVWLAGQMRDVWTASEDEVRGQLDERIRSAIDDARRAGTQEQIRWERLLGFHPETRLLTQSLIDEAIDRGEFAPAEIRLRRLIDVADPVIAASAFLQLGELLVEFGQFDDAIACLLRLEREYPDVILEDGRTGAEHSSDWFENSDLSRESLAPRPVGIWSHYKFEIENRRAESGRALVQPVSLTDDGAEFFRRNRFEFEPNTQQLVVSPTGSASPYWSSPLRMTQPQVYNQSAAVAAYGLQAVVFHGGVLHALSLPDQKVLWTEPVDRVGSAYTRHVVTDSVVPLQPATRFLANSALKRRSAQHGMLAHACAEYIARHGRREVRVLDPLTGDVLWTCSGIAPQTTIFGDDHAIYLTAGNGSTRVMRATDGRVLKVSGLEDLVENAVAWGPRGAIVVERGDRNVTPDEGRAPLTVRAVAPRTLEAYWSREFDDRARLSLIDDRLLLVLEPSGDCHVVDFETGKSTRLGRLPEDMMDSETHAVADSEFIYLLVDHLPNQSVSYVNQPVVRLNGTVFAMRRNGDGIAWQRKVENQNLLLTQFEHSPLMVFLSYQSKLEEALRFTYFNVRVLALDKQTGRVAAELDKPMPGGGGFYQVHLDIADRAFDIRSHNRRIRIHAVDELSTVDQGE